MPCGAGALTNMEQASRSDLKMGNVCATSDIKHPWVIVTDPGTGLQRIYNDYPSFFRAHIALKELDYQAGNADIMKRLSDGTLTTEF